MRLVILTALMAMAWPASAATPSRASVLRHVLSKMKAGRIDRHDLRFETIRNDDRLLELRVFHRKAFAAKMEVYKRGAEATISFIGVHHRMHGKGLGLALHLIAGQWAHDRKATLAKSDDTTAAEDALWQGLKRNGMAENASPAGQWTPNPESDGVFLRLRPGVFAGKGYRSLLDLVKRQPVPPGASWVKEPKWRFGESEFFRSGGPTMPIWATGEKPVTD